MPHKKLRRRSAVAAVIRRPNLLVVQQFPGRTFDFHFAGFKHVAAIGNGQRHVRILLNQQNGRAPRMDDPDGRK